MATHLSRLLLLIVFFMLPSASSAAALTQQQANSLIAVVQSSPGTSASAFVSLITAFSNITTAQAASLIAVVQAAPGVPANAFVELLTSFTVDAIVVTNQVKCNPTYPTDENMMLTDDAPPQINIRNLIGYWHGDTIHGIVSAVAPGMVMDEQNCSRMTLSRRSGSPAYIEYFVDGVSIGYPKGAPNFSSDSMVLDTTKYVDGPHTISVTAMDAAGHKSSEGLDFFIKNNDV